MAPRGPAGCLLDAEAEVAKILVVDDDPELGAVMAELLADEGHEVRIVTNGRAGLEALDRSLPDVVLLDVEMPLLDGPGMAYEMLLRDMGLERIPVVLASGVFDLERVAGRVGTPYFVTKPCALDRLLETVDRALRERVPPHPHEGAA